MSLVVLENVGIHFGSRAIVESLSVRIARGERIGLIGPNGSGKTTLLRVFSGQMPVDDGKVITSKGTRIGYLPQDIALEGGSGLLEFVLASVPGKSEIDQELHEVTSKLESDQASGDEEYLLELSATLAELHDRLDHFASHFSEHYATQILAGLGFTTSDLKRDIGEFSGGWKMRAVLAALLFQQPDVLLLDEPTNHLDLPSVAWFSQFLKSYKRAFVLISHDREFLNEQINRVVSFEIEGVRQYQGNYDAYEKRRAEELEILENKARNVERERAHMERFVERFRAKASKAASVRGRVKALEKLETVETIGERRTLRFQFPPCDRTANDVVVAKGLSKAYGNLRVFAGVDITIRRGQRIAIIGSNGAGKTTLLKMLAGELPADGGDVKLGNGVKLGYYAQHHAEILDRRSTIYDEAARVTPDSTISKIRSVLGAFLFSGDDVDKSIGVLSGGERARVALAKLLLKPGNLLLMDEPSNHLDLKASEALAESLTTFDGTLVFVSHNRSFVRTLANVIWNVENGDVEVYPGTLDEYMYSCQQRLANQDASAAGGSNPSGSAHDADKPSTVPKVKKTKEQKRLEAEQRNRRFRELEPLQSRLGRIEAKIAKLEGEQETRTAEFEDPAVYEDEDRRSTLQSGFDTAKAKLEKLHKDWERIAEAVENKKLELGITD